MVSFDLPDDVVKQILSWLPVIGLIRFKGVCKSWSALIESSEFIAKHLHHTTLKDNGSIVVQHRVNRTDKDTFLLLSGKNYEVSVNLDFFQYFKDDSCVELEILGCCNGIICLHDHSRNFGDFSLWNPATRELKAVSRSRFSEKRYHTYYGFGFDAKTNDYKIVNIEVVDIDWTREEFNNIKTHVVVYSLSGDSWRLIDAAFPVYQIKTVKPPPRADLNGIYYWCALLYSCDEVMLSFDMSTEMFRITPFPNSCGDENWKTVTVLNDSVALVLYCPGSNARYFETWVLDDSIDSSWKKLYRIGPLYGFGEPLGFSKNSELFIQLHKPLVLWDPVTLQIKCLQVEAEYRTLMVCLYTESLVSLKGGNCPTKSLEDNSSVVV